MAYAKEIYNANTGFLRNRFHVRGVGALRLYRVLTLTLSLGGAIALAAYQLWPTWESAQVNGMLARMRLRRALFTCAFPSDYKIDSRNHQTI